MSLKGKILHELKTRYKHLGFGEKAFDAVAEMLDNTAAEESEISTVTGGVETLLRAFQGDADKRVTEALARQKSPKVAVDNNHGAAGNDDVPGWAQGLIESNRALMEKVGALETGKTTESRRATLDELLKDTPESFRQMKLRDFVRMSFRDESEFETYKTELEAGLEEVRPLFGEQGLGKLPPPIPGRTARSGVSVDTQAYIDARKAEREGRGLSPGKAVFGEKAETGATAAGMGKQVF